MKIVAVIIICAAVFGVCFLVDKGFTRLFRSQSQHHSGKAVRLNKRYGSFGLILLLFGVAVLFAGLAEKWLFVVCGGILILVGVGLVTYYMTFGVFYDEDSFVLTTFGKKSATYQYKNITGQKLYITQGQHTLVELYLDDGRTFQIQQAMTGGFDFLDYAFSAWLRQTGKREEDCDFHDPANCCWFPSVEV